MYIWLNSPLKTVKKTAQYKIKKSNILVKLIFKKDNIYAKNGQ